MYCKHCGQQIADGTVRCPECGAAQTEEMNETVDKGGFLWGLLGCCIPIVGLILFLVWKDSKPKTAKAAIIGAAIGFGLSIISSILSYVVGMSAAVLGGMY